jgi:hypothetical protein
LPTTLPTRTARSSLFAPGVVTVEYTPVDTGASLADLTEQVEAWHHAPDRPDGPGRYVQHLTQAEAKLLVG